MLILNMLLPREENYRNYYVHDLLLHLLININKKGGLYA
jgi:hypothetical protein